MLSSPKLNRILSVSLISVLCFSSVNAQLSKNPDKFLGNITTSYQVDFGEVPYWQLWNQITPENESKWGSVESNRGSYNWGSDTPFNYAKNHSFTYKFHALVWGAQYPSWFNSSMSVNDRYNAIVKWFDEVKKHYPDLPMIDVVNEAVGMHQQGNPLMKESLGGGGKTGYDWLIKAFELAHERWPNAILIYNDYNTFQWDTDAYIDLVRTLRDAGAPIDAYGCQSHDLTDCDYNKFTTAEQKIHSALNMPMYITEYDISTEDDDYQLKRYKEQVPYLWEKDYCAGFTIWGYIYGRTWDQAKYSGLIKYENNKNNERPAMTWLREYMASDAAKNAKSPFPGGKKPISLYIKPASTTITINDTLPITVRATLHDTIKTVGGVKDTIRIDSIKLYVKGVLDTILTKAPYVAKYVPTTTGKHDLKAVVYTNKGNTYERLGSFRAHNPRSAYNNDTIKLPGTLQVENYDKGDEGVTYHDNDAKNQGDASFRTAEGVDIVKGNNGKAIGYTNTDEWLEYTVNIKEPGYYSYQAVASSGTTGSGFRLSISDDEGLTDITDNISVPKTADNDWSVYTTMTGRTKIPLKAGDQTIRLTITGSNCNVDKIVFNHVEINESINLKVTATPSTGTLGSSNTFSFTAGSAGMDSTISFIKVFMNGKQVTDTIRTQPFQWIYKASTAGTNSMTAIAVDTLNRESNITAFSLKVRGPYNGTITIPGTIQAENYDKGGEGLTFHDSNSEKEGDDQDAKNYRSDEGGVDIVNGNGGKVIGYTNTGEWLEYSINVARAGYYSYSATVSSGVTGSGFRIGLMEDGKETQLFSVSVPQTGDNNWGTYKTVSGNIKSPLESGKQVIRLTITGSSCNIDKVYLSFVSSVKYVTPDDVKANGTRYNLGGAIVGDDYKGIVIIDGKKVLQK